VMGAANIGLAILISNTKGIIEIIIKVLGALAGPIVGVFLIGFFLPKCNIKGVWTGLILSYVMVLWITIGSMIYKTPTKMLPFSADECDHDHLNFTSLTFKNDQKNFSLANLTTIDENSEDP
ncbi:Sodium-coupled monocarboxylate transporter 1, partial [Armadillidium vulgare]